MWLICSTLLEQTEVTSQDPIQAHNSIKVNKQVLRGYMGPDIGPSKKSDKINVKAENSNAVTQQGERKPDSPACRAEVNEFRNAADREILSLADIHMPPAVKDVNKVRRLAELRDVKNACGPERAKQEDKSYKAMREDIEKEFSSSFDEKRWEAQSPTRGNKDEDIGKESMKALEKRLRAPRLPLDGGSEH